MESDSDTYKNSYDCPRCTEKMPSKPIDEELDHGLVLACPECGKEKLSVECFLHWDKKRRLLDKGEYLDALLTISRELKENLT